MLKKSAHDIRHIDLIIYILGAGLAGSGRSSMARSRSRSRRRSRYKYSISICSFLKYRIIHWEFTLISTLLNFLLDPGTVIIDHVTDHVPGQEDARNLGTEEAAVTVAGLVVDQRIAKGPAAIGQDLKSLEKKENGREAEIRGEAEEAEVEIANKK